MTEMEGKWAADLVPANQQAGNSYIFGLKKKTPMELHFKDCFRD